MKRTAEDYTLVLPADCTGTDTILALAGELSKALRHRPARLVIDGSGVKRFGSMAVGALANAAREAAEVHCQLVLRAFTIPARQPFEICRLADYFTWE